MIRATISEVKNSLSAYLRKVKAGETIVIMDRKIPIASITPIQLQPDAAGDAKLLRLEQAGIVARSQPGHPLDALADPLQSGASILEALLEERRDDR